MPDPIIPAIPTPPTPVVPPVVVPVPPAPIPPVVDPVDQPLGEPGLRALERVREEAAESRREAATLKAELEALRAAQMSDTDKAIAAAKAEGAAEVSTRFAARVLLSEIRVAAAGKLADPNDAVRLLDLTKFTVTDDGTVDTTAITSAIDELVIAKPYLAAGKSPPPTIDNGQGPRGNPATPTDPGSLSMSDYMAARKAGTIQ